MGSKLKLTVQLGFVAFVAGLLSRCSQVPEEETLPSLPDATAQMTQKPSPANSETVMKPVVQQKSNKEKKKQSPAQILKEAKGAKATPEELVLLAERYYNGVNVPQDIVKGLSYFVQAANLGSGYACRRLGMEYSDFAFNDKTPRDDKKARAWFEKGAALGDPESIFYLSQFVFEGRGGDKDEKRATMLLLQAAQANSQYAAHRVLKLSKQGVYQLSDAEKWKFYQLDKNLRYNVMVQ